MATEREWNVSIEITHGLGAGRALRVLERMQQTLQRYAAAGAAGPTSLDVLLSVDADSATTALTKGLWAFLSALVRARGDKGAEIVAVAIELPEHVERKLEQQNQIALVGIREPGEPDEECVAVIEKVQGHCIHSPTYSSEHSSELLRRIRLYRCLVVSPAMSPSTPLHTPKRKRSRGGGGGGFASALWRIAVGAGICG